MDDWPPWKEKPKNSHSGRILAIARCIFEMHYTTELHATKGEIKTFDNRCASDLEGAARVLNQSGFTRFIDDIGRRSVFLCEPPDFEKIALSEDAQKVSGDQVCDAITWLANSYYKSSEEIDYLAEIMK